MNKNEDNIMNKMDENNSLKDEGVNEQSRWRVEKLCKII